MYYTVHTVCTVQYSTLAVACVVTVKYGYEHHTESHINHTVLYSTSEAHNSVYSTYCTVFVLSYCCWNILV